MSPRVTFIEPAEFGEPNPYLSQAAVANGLIFVAGQVAWNADGSVVAKGDPYGQTHAALDNLETVLKTAGASLADIVSATIFLTDESYAAEYNRAWTERFQTKPPRATAVSGLLAPDLLVEIQAIALAPAG